MNTTIYIILACFAVLGYLIVSNPPQHTEVTQVVHVERTWVDVAEKWLSLVSSLVAIFWALFGSFVLDEFRADVKESISKVSPGSLLERAKQAKPVFSNLLNVVKRIKGR